MYDALEAVLQKYLDHDLIQKEADTQAAEEEGDKPLVIAVSGSSEKPRRLKTLLGNGYKGVFVRDTDSAARYLAKLPEKHTKE